jgi:hypothetical protein
MPVTQTHPTADSELALALERGLAAPLRAIEALLAQVSRDLGETRLRAPQAALASARRQAESAVELFRQRPLREDTCTVRELAWSARAAIPAPERERVWVATEHDGGPLSTDAPTFSRALAGLIAHAISTTAGEVLLHGNQDGGEATFAVVEDLGALGDPLEAAPQVEPTPELLLARADLARLGAQVDEHSAGPHRCTTILLGGQR